MGSTLRPLDTGSLRWPDYLSVHQEVRGGLTTCLSLHTGKFEVA